MTRKADSSLSLPAYEGRSILLHSNSLVSRGLQDVIRQKTIADIRQSGAPNVITNSIGVKMVLIPAGDFLMGSAESPEELARLFPGTEAAWYTLEQPQHRVKITQPFAIGQSPVTVREFRAFVDDVGYKTDAETRGGGDRWTGTEWKLDPEIDWRSPGFVQTDDDPVVLTSWDDAHAYCQWLRGKEGCIYRLPTEAEWEYACRAGSRSRFSFGDDIKYLGEYAWYNENSNDITHPVRQKKPNAWGLHDMHGNVKEWCSDWWGVEYYKQCAGKLAIDPTGPRAGTLRVKRGGSWVSVARDCRSAYRGLDTAGSRYPYGGFRLARTVSKPAADTA
jgi:formylglycine-generating enzyme required for sulfatase activity